MSLLTGIIFWLNRLANTFGSIVLAPIRYLPGWCSATIVAVVTGILMLLIFKYTSNQTAIRRTRNDIKANLLSLSLFRDNVWLSLRSQGRILLAALRLSLLAVVPMLVMVIPMCLLLGQLALWYQARPVPVGQEALVAMELSQNAAWPRVELQPNPAVEVTTGPVRVEANRMYCWSVRAIQAGYHDLTFDVDGQPIVKELATGDDFMRVSIQRPSGDWTAALMHPAETPFPLDSAIRNIQIDYPSRTGWTCGSSSWLVYWFAASMVAALCFRRVFKVNL